MKGLDYAWSHVPPQLVKAAGFGFAARYLSHDATKNLSRAEADALLAEGVAIVLVWEDTAQGALRGHAGGVADALAADAQARACGLPGAFIYFAADWDATPAQQLAVNDYLDGCATVIGRTRVGLYGGYWACSRARAGAKALKYWGTVAWSGGNWATATWKPDVMQGAQVTIDGVSVDLDTGGAAGADFGQWPRPAPVPAPAPAVPGDEDTMMIVTVDQATVPKGTAWPGVFNRVEDASAPLGVKLVYIQDPAHLAALRAVCVPDAPKLLPYADWLLLGGKPA
jgi:hypothetical protein